MSNLYNIEVVNEGLIKGLNMTSELRASRYTVSYKCSSVGTSAFFMLYGVNSLGEYKSYFLPIQFAGEVKFYLEIDSDITYLELNANLNGAVITELIISTVDDPTLEYVKENSSYWDKIKDITSNTGKVRADMLEGLIDLTLNAFANESGTITQENGIMTWLNGTTVENSTQAVQITGGAIRIANSRLSNGDWNWTTAINGAGINAATIIAETFAALNITGVTITAGTITGGTITGVTINGSKFISSDSTGGETMTLNAGRIDFNNGQDVGMLDSGALNLFGDQGNVHLEAYNSFSIGAGSMLFSNNTLILGNTRYSNNIKLIDDGYIELNPSWKAVRCTADFEVWGDKNSIIPTQHYGVRALYAEEADKAYFSTKGIINMQALEYQVELDPIFLETIEHHSACPYIIQLTAYSDAHVYVAAITDIGFTIKANKPTQVAYDLKAIRISYSSVYLEEKMNYSNKQLSKIQEAAVRRME